MKVSCRSKEVFKGWPPELSSTQNCNISCACQGLSLQEVSQFFHRSRCSEVDCQQWPCRCGHVLHPALSKACLYTDLTIVSEARNLSCVIYNLVSLCQESKCLILGKDVVSSVTQLVDEGEEDRCTATIDDFQGITETCCSSGSEGEALLLGNDMLHAGLLHHVKFKRPFQNNGNLYR